MFVCVCVCVPPAHQLIIYELLQNHTTNHMNVIRSTAQVVSFACGTGRLPAEGFVGLAPPFRVDVVPTEDPENLPSAHTCFNQLCLPPYASKKALSDKLHLAIQAGGTGFGFI